MFDREATMGLFDTVQISGDVLGSWSLTCPDCNTLVSPHAQWQTKSLDPCMRDYYLRHGDGGVRLFLLDAPSDRRFWCPFTHEEIEESRRLADERGGLYRLWIKEEGDGTYLPPAYLPEHRSQRCMGELPHQWVELHTSCRCGAWITRWLEFTDGLAGPPTTQEPLRPRTDPSYRLSWS